MSAETDEIYLTAVAAAAPLGRDAEAVWAAVRRGACGVTATPTALEQLVPPGKGAGQAPDLPTEYEPDLPREARYLRWVLEALLRDAGDLPYAPDRRALLLGTTLHGMRAGGAFLRDGDHDHLRTFLAGDVARLAARGLGFGNLTATTCSACSSSLGAIALGATLLRSGAADLVVAGGYDALSEYAWAGFDALRVVSDEHLRPFARGRRGMKLAEGWAVVALERRCDAEARGAKVIATLAGWGESADAFHLTRPEPTGAGALAAMRQAVGRAGIQPRDLDLVAAHATGTPDNDASEAAALHALLGGDLPSVPVVGFKAALGHTLGGAGAVELVLSALALRDGVVPPTANAGETEHAALNVSRAERRVDLRHTLNTSLGFGGANTCVVLRRHERRDVWRGGHVRRAAYVTGIAAIVPGAVGNDAFLALVRGERPPSAATTVDDADLEPHYNARRARRMSPYVKLSVCCATLACRHAGLLDFPELLAATGAIFGTTHGSAGYCHDYYAEVVRGGMSAANPMLFAEGVPNAAAAQASLALGLKGSCQTIVGTATAGVDALRLAIHRIECGEAERVLVCAAEEPHFTLDAAYARCGGGPSCAAAVAFVVESPTVVDARYARTWANLTHDVSASRATLGEALQRVLDNYPRDRRLAEPPFALAGQAFSAAPLLALAAHLLAGDDACAAVVAADRTGVASGVAVVPL